jgi:hypothetical protein
MNSNDLQFAFQISDEAAAVAMGFFGSVVTEADRAVEQLLQRSGRRLHSNAALHDLLLESLGYPSRS